jgi:hypothetical protein
VVAVILLEALVALFLFNGNSDFIPDKRPCRFFFLLNSLGGCNPVKSCGGFSLLEAVVALFLFNSYSNFIPV